jgi:hypothetical protein
MMGGFVFETNHEHDATRKRLRTKDLYNLLKTGQLLWPEIEEREISDRSKSDWSVKSLALVQILWFITQLAGRVVQGLAVTTLELFTLGIVFCAVCTYSLWWAKPFDIRQPIVIEDKKRATASSDSCARVGLSEDGFHESEWRFNAIFLLIVIIFGGIHVVAWQFHFPTYAEQLTWRICSIVSTIIPIIFGLYFHFSEDEYNVSTVIVGFYVVVRLYMFVEMFVGLRSVPASVYKTPEWSDYFPTFS